MRSLSFIVILLLLAACQQGDASMETLGHGASLYKKHCANCHQQDGSGLASLIPPLNQSDYLAQHAEQLPCIIKQGLKGKIMVNGKDYQLLMPAAPKLSQQELKDLSVFVWQKFMQEPPPQQIQAVALATDSCNF